MKTVIYLVRHGDVHNPKKIFYGRMPGFVLSGLGRLQAQKLGKFLSQKPIAAIYASPLERTRETAAYIASHHINIPIYYDKRLLEVHSHTQGKALDVLAIEQFNFYKQKYLKSGGETLSDIWKRMRMIIQEILKKYKGQEIVVVSHGDPVMVSMIKHKGRPLRFSEIRKEDYVQTAQGFRIVFEEFSAVEVSKLDI
jgi:broad specificity phosphatase PhoE